MVCDERKHKFDSLNVAIHSKKAFCFCKGNTFNPHGITFNENEHNVQIKEFVKES